MIVDQLLTWIPVGNLVGLSDSHWDQSPFAEVGRICVPIKWNRCGQRGRRMF